MEWIREEGEETIFWFSVSNLDGESWLRSVEGSNQSSVNIMGR
jgi:hypothetical protein